MIEVEKKFILNEGTEKKVLEAAEFLGKETFTDVYYDAPDCKLLSNDIWFRQRDGKFELKIFVPGPAGRSMDQYEEIDDEKEIIKRLNLPNSATLEGEIEKGSYPSFCICRTERRKFKTGDFTIVLDDAEFDGGFNFKIGEIELMVNDKSRVGDAVKRIEEFAAANGLSKTPENGKIVEYLKARRPLHYKAFLGRKPAPTVI